MKYVKKGLKGLSTFVHKKLIRVMTALKVIIGNKNEVYICVMIKNYKSKIELSSFLLESLIIVFSSFLWSSNLNNSPLLIFCGI